MERGGQLDILVNNVGGSRNARIWEMKADDWDFVLRLNLRSTFLCTRAAVPHMMRRRYGRIVCLSSGAREGTPWTAYYQGGAAYSAAKAGVHGFIRDVALELAEHGINVHPYVGGAKGTPHGANYEIVDPALTYLTNAKALASMVVDLLADGAAVGRQVVAQAKPPLTRQAYLDFQRRISRRETYDGAGPSPSRARR